VRALIAIAAVVVTAVVVAGCGSGSTKTVTVARTVHETTHVDVLRPSQTGAAQGTDPQDVYRAEAPGVVTIIGQGVGPNSTDGLGSGFVVSGDGDIATNAHVVTGGSGSSVHRARHVYVRFSDGAQVEAKIVGFDPNSDVALLRVPPSGLNLHPLPLGKITDASVGAPAMVIGSPFGEDQSLSVGVISGLDRTISSLTGFTIEGAIQTDAAINHGNSGGPLLDARGRVLGIASQIDTSSGEGSGVGFAVPVDTVRRSLAQLRSTGKVRYAFLGVRTTDVFPQLAQRFGLSAQHGAYVEDVQAGGPGAKAGIRSGTGSRSVFQGVPFRGGGDVIVGVGKTPVHQASEVARALAPYRPGDRIAIHIVRDGKPMAVTVTLGTRPSAPSP
jgi:S1-C subfamily serine protease